MGALALLLDPALAPFSLALAVVGGLLLVELLSGFLGLSLMGEDADAAPDLGVDAGPDLDIPGPEVAGPVTAGAAGGVAGWLGFGRIPAVLWLAGMLTAFGLAGYILQLAVGSATGLLLPAWLAALLALPPGIVAGRWFGRTLGRIVPRTETSAISRRSLGDRVGVIVQGTARRGLPAQARVRDGHGNLHYVRVEPVDDDGEIAAGTEVIVMRGRESVLRAIPLGGSNEGETR